MANSSYLCAMDEASLYPSSTVEGFDPATGVVAFDRYCVPLLWLALFRPADLRTETFTFEDGEAVQATAPLVPKDRALAQLDAALPALGRLFAAEGPLDAHAALLRQAVEKAPGGYLTVELDEIEAMWEEGTFGPALHAALASLDGETDPPADRARLVELAQLRPDGPFPPARLIIDGLEAGDAGYWNFTRLLGTGFQADVPWELAAPTG
ncbi:hypothetical protein AB0M43_06590 [Longispora sp. NPDC051575]|uniref:hypothetical protein n=1 Tax=Longispora sp. NPDC051575 TaxID=3154943 RepID=UPI00341E6D3B